MIFRVIDLYYYIFKEKYFSLIKKKKKLKLKVIWPAKQFWYSICIASTEIQPIVVFCESKPPPPFIYKKNNFVLMAPFR